MQNFSADSRHDYFADGLTEALIANLAQVDGLRVTSRTSSMYYKGQRKPRRRSRASSMRDHRRLDGHAGRSAARHRAADRSDTDEHLWAKT